MVNHKKLHGGWKLTRRSFFLLMVMGLILLASCIQGSSAGRSSSTVSDEVPLAPTLQSWATRSTNPDPPPLTTEPAPRETAAPDSGWQEVRQGLERRVINLDSNDDSSTQSLYILRIDPNLYQFNVGYHPGEAQSLLKWGEESEALIVVNGGYFTEDNHATGLIVSEGVSSGSSYLGYGGMFSVGSRGPMMHWLQQQPYDETEPLLAAVQSFPMLITPGGQLGYKDETGEKARRTVVAIDRDGGILLIISPSATFTLAELGRYLINSDLNLDAALNMDGGASTGLLLAEPLEGIPAFSELPSVLLVYPK
jgi:hypothetical protein